VVGAIVGAAAVSIALRLNSPPHLMADAGFDDALYAHQGWMLANERWLGPYSFATLTKGPGYPLFIAIVYRLDLPLKLAEHVLYLAASGVLAVAVWRMAGARRLAVVLFVALALDPSHFGAASSLVSRDNFYSALCLLLVGLVLLVTTEVPAIGRRRAASAVPLALAVAAVLGMVAAAYFITREERIWLAPTLLVAVAAGVLSWRRPVTRPAAIAAVSLTVVIGAGLTASWAIGEVRERNQAAYGSDIIGDLAEGEGARVYAAWQRVDLGPADGWVTVNAEQRRAVYDVSPAAAELAEHLEGYGTRWMGKACYPTFTQGCDYRGGQFVWVLREAAWWTGHAGDAAELQAFLGRMADEIGAACDDGRLPCLEPGPAGMPPLERVDTASFWSSAHRLTTHLVSFEPGDPGRARRSQGTPEAWSEMVRPLRGIDQTMAEYDRMAEDAVGRQWPVAALVDVYRTVARIGVVTALAGLAVTFGFRGPRQRRGSAAALALVLLVGVASRIAALTVVDATAFDARFDPYFLPATGFLVGFLVVGNWLLVQAVRERRVSAREARRAEEVEPEGDGDDRLDAPTPRDARLVPQ
jgi:hypothetical protein